MKERRNNNTLYKQSHDGFKSFQKSIQNKEIKRKKKHQYHHNIHKRKELKHQKQFFRYTGAITIKDELN